MYSPDVGRNMKYIGVIFLIVLVLAIMVGGSYNRQEVIQTQIQLVPTSVAQPELVESTLAEYNGIYSVQLSRSDHVLRISYNKARFSLDDLCHILIALGYQVPTVEPAHVSATM